MVKGLQRFREYFRDFTDAFVVIGGVACDEWLGMQGLGFRPTRDVDMVLVLETLTPAFVRRFWDFVHDAGYENRQRSTGRRIYYRFSRPVVTDAPAMIEIFSRQPSNLDIADGQKVVPIDIADELSSLSAILVDDAYYRLIRECRILSGDLPIVTGGGLIPLKARAWLDLTRRHAEGRSTNEDDIRKHRRDVFRLAAALPVQEGPDVAESIRDDLRQFVVQFPPGAPVWEDLIRSLRTDLGATMPDPQDLLAVIDVYFRLGVHERVKRD